jgi:5-methylcytosine-specific restriction protein A
MPRTPKQTTCLDLGCNNPKEPRSFFCLEHGAKKLVVSKPDSKERKALNAKYASKQWRQFRQIQLSKYPICARCQSLGKITPATDVDHIIPHKMNVDKWMGNRFQSLCKSCHSIKTGLEQRGQIHDYVIGKIYRDQRKT